MPFNGSGTFSLVAGNPVVTGTVISSTVQNNTTSDFATAFTNCVTRDGQSAALANLPMGGFKHTGAAVATAANQYLTYGQALNGTTGTFSGAVSCTDLTTTGNNILGNAQADTLNVGNGDIIKDASGNVIGTGTVGADGNFQVSLDTPAPEGESLAITLKDAAGNESAPGALVVADIETPLAPRNLAISDVGDTLSGEGAAAHKVIVLNDAGEVVGSGTVADDGTFLVQLNSLHINGERLRVFLRNFSGKESLPGIVIAGDTIAWICLIPHMNAQLVICFQNLDFSRLSFRPPMAVTLRTVYPGYTTISNTNDMATSGSSPASFLITRHNIRPVRIPSYKSWTVISPRIALSTTGCKTASVCGQ